MSRKVMRNIFTTPWCCVIVSLFMCLPLFPVDWLKLEERAEQYQLMVCFRVLVSQEGLIMKLDFRIVSLHFSIIPSFL